MPNGTKGDHPITDILVHGLHPFPKDLENVVLKVHELEPRLIEFLPLQDWERRIGLETAVAQCEEMLERYPREGWTFLGELPFRQSDLEEPDQL